MARLFGCKQNINISSKANLQRSQHLLSQTWSTSGLASLPGQGHRRHHHHDRPDQEETQ